MVRFTEILSRFSRLKKDMTAKFEGVRSRNGVRIEESRTERIERTKTESGESRIELVKPGLLNFIRYPQINQLLVQAAVKKRELQSGCMPQMKVLGTC